MDILLCVTADTCFGKGRRKIDRVTGLARERIVAALQRESRNHPVIEVRRGPGRIVVTTRASSPVAAIVHVILAMT